MTIAEACAITGVLSTALSLVGGKILSAYRSGKRRGEIDMTLQGIKEDVKVLQDKQKEHDNCIIAHSSILESAKMLMPKLEQLLQSISSIPNELKGFIDSHYLTKAVFDERMKLLDERNVTMVDALRRIESKIDTGGDSGRKKAQG